MANVVVMFSGGSNSTYALWRWLSETDHSILAIRGRIQDAEPTRMSEADEASRAAEIVNWLKTNVRDFDFETVDFPAYEQEEGPLRPDFVATFNYGCLRPRYTYVAQMIADRQPDIVVIGLSVENTSHWGWPYFQSLVEDPNVDFYFAGSPDLTVPLPQGDDYSHSEMGKILTGKCYQYSQVPDEIKPLCRNWRGDESDPRNLQMLIWKAIDAWLADGKDPAEFDRYCAELGHYGPYCDLADPEKAIYRSSQFLTDGFVENYLADIAGIERHWKHNVV